MPYTSLLYATNVSIVSLALTLRFAVSRTLNNDEDDVTKPKEAEVGDK